MYIIWNSYLENTFCNLKNGVLMVNNTTNIRDTGSRFKVICKRCKDVFEVIRNWVGGIRRVDNENCNPAICKCSCHHEMYVQCQLVVDGELERLHILLFNSGYNNYTIESTLKVMDGYSYPTMQVLFYDKKKIER